MSIVIRAAFFICVLQILLFAQSKGGRWQFENNGFDTADWDAVENGGTLQNQASYSSAAPLIEGNAFLWLDSSEVHDYFRVDDDNDLDFTDEDIAISLWVYPIILNDVHYLINKGRQDSNPKTTNYSLRIANNTWELEFLIRDSNNQAQSVASSFAVPTNQWTFLAVFYDFSDSKVYMWNDPNSAAVDTLNFAQSYFANDDPLSIGSWYRADPSMPSVKDFEGRIDDVRISGRLADVFPGPTSIDESEQLTKEGASASFEIYPNPSSLSNKETSIMLHLNDLSINNVNLTVYNILGQEIFRKILLNPRNGQVINWRALNNQNRQIPAGIYFIRMSGNDLNIMRKIMFIK